MDSPQPSSKISLHAQQTEEQDSPGNSTQAISCNHMQADAEKSCTGSPLEAKKSVYAGLGWLDRLLVLWILLAIIGGILLGNFVHSVGPALQRGKFVQVSVPIGEPEYIYISIFPIGGLRAHH